MSFALPTSRPTRLLALLAAVLVAVLVTMITPSGASADVQPALGTLDSGNFSAFSQTNALQGTLGVVSGGYGGSESAQATYSGGGNNGYARAIFNVNWQEGNDVWYGGAYLLPTGFHSAMQGQVALLRWDNYLSNPNSADQGGVVINGGDKHSYLERDHNNADGSWSQSDLVGPFDLPEGRWFWLEVHQHLGAGAGAYSEVFLDGRSLGSSSAPNMSGVAIERIRYGLVAIAEGKQMGALSLQFDRASVATSQLGPIANMVGPPVPSLPSTSSGSPTPSGTPGAQPSSASSGSGSGVTPPPTSGKSSGHKSHPTAAARAARRRAHTASALRIGRCVLNARVFARRHHRSSAHALQRCAALVARISARRPSH